MEPKNKIFIYLLVVFFAAFVGTGLYLMVGDNREKSNINKKAAADSRFPTTLKQENLVMPTVVPTTGFLRLDNFEKNWAAGGSYKIGEVVNLTLIANSAGKKIVGYDAILFYDPLAFEFMEVKTVLPDFQIKSYARGGRLFLTAFQSTSYVNSPIFGGEKKTETDKIAGLSFKAKKTGLLNIDLLSSSGNEKTDFVSDQTEVLNPELAGATVSVK